jgi:crotonobetainyl-CoA:carnitine CoA-transferase CaiB-like acyl-CoA transferase
MVNQVSTFARLKNYFWCSLQNLPDMTDTFFKDLIVVELASVLAGPAVGMFFAELGARVIKVENRETGGDITRRWKVPEEDPDDACSAYWCSVNWGKEVHLIDLQTEDGKAFVTNLVEGADVVISNFKTSSAQRLGMDAGTLRKRNSRLIYAQLYGFSETEERPAFDVVLQAEAGFMYMTGEPGRRPVKMPVALIDLMAAHQLKEGILVALLHRLKTGEGSLVKTSLFEAALASLANQATNWLMAGHVPQPFGSMHPNIAPYGDLFTCKDGKSFVLAVGTEKQFECLCRVFDVPHLAVDGRFCSNALRVQHRQALVATLTPVFQQLSLKVLMKKFAENGIPAGRIRNIQEVFDMPEAQQLVLKDKLPDGKMARRVKTVAFCIV